MSRRCRLQIEELGTRILPSVSVLPLPVLSAAPMLVAAPHHALAGQGSGTYVGGSLVVDAGESATLQGSAHLARLGDVTVNGSVQGLGLILSGHASGTLTFSNKQGSVTVALEGPEQKGFAPLPPHFHYHVVSGTGAYEDLKDHGSLELTLQPVVVDPPGPAGHIPVAQGVFTLTIAGGRNDVAPPPKLVSGIEGVALVGPISPVERPGVPNTRPLAGAVIEVETVGGIEVARVVADQNGKFQIRLLPGRYRLVPLPPKPNQVLPRGAPQTVVVRPGEYTDVTVNYDSGIR